LLIDLLFVPSMILSGCCCGKRRPCSQQRVSSDFLQIHPTSLNDDWASRHPEVVPSHRRAQQIWKKYSRKLPNGKFKLEAFSLRRVRLVHKLAKYTRLKREQQNASADALGEYSVGSKCVT
jgi:hypothetical protein